MNFQQLFMGKATDDVIGLRLASGEELMGKFQSVEYGEQGQSGILYVSKMRHILVHRNAEGIAVSLMPWSFCNVDAINSINISQIVALLQPDAEMVKNYLQQTSSIQLLS